MEYYLMLGIVFVFVYTYIFYPVLLWLASIFTQTPEQPSINEQPLVTFIVPVYNAENFIREKIKNSLTLTYPKDKIQYLFVSDCSSDNTESILAEYGEISVLRMSERSGKEKALQYAISYAKGSVVCFTDAGTLVDADCIERVIARFSDPGIGVISSYDHFDSSSFSVESLHIRYEMLFRELESKVTSTVGVSGSFFAARLSLCQKLKNEHSCSDLEIAFISVRNGLRAVLDKNLFGYYAKTNTTSNEFHRQVRIVSHGINTVAINSDMLNPFKYGLYSWQLFSHKIVRWFVPMLMLFFPVLVLIALLRSNLDLATMALFVFIPATITGLILIATKKYSFVLRSIRMIFVYTFAVFAAVFRVISGKKVVTWNPTQRNK